MSVAYQEECPDVRSSPVPERPDVRSSPASEYRDVRSSPVSEYPDVRASLVEAGRALRVAEDPVLALVWRTGDLLLTGDPRAEDCLRDLADRLAAGDHLTVGLVMEAVGVTLAIRAGRLHAAGLGTQPAVGGSGVRPATGIPCTNRSVRASGANATTGASGAKTAVRASGADTAVPDPFPGDPFPGEAVPGEVAVVSCRREGDRWRLSFDGRTALVDDGVGMRLLAILIADPGQEIAAADLAAHLAGQRDGGMFDWVARSYREQLLRLQAEIDDLESAGATWRAAARRVDRDRLAAKLAAATRQGARRPTDPDQARITVGKAIHHAVTGIAATDPMIGGELRATVHIGRHCAYRPR